MRRGAQVGRAARGGTRILGVEGKTKTKNGGGKNLFWKDYRSIFKKIWGTPWAAAPCKAELK